MVKKRKQKVAPASKRIDSDDDVPAGKAGKAGKAKGDLTPQPPPRPGHQGQPALQRRVHFDLARDFAFEDFFAGRPAPVSRWKISRRGPASSFPLGRNRMSGFMHSAHLS
mgnify:CR=1 FL=1